MRICPVDREWIHNYVLEPYLQGAELINQAWKGVDRSLTPIKLKLLERVICWIQGMCLMLPFINTIIWLAWQALGPPDKLFEPYCPEIDPPPPVMPEVIIHGAPEPVPVVIPVAVPENMVKPTENFGFKEVTDIVLQTKWKIEHFPDMIVAQQNCDLFSSTSIYRPNYSLREYHYQMGTKKIDAYQNGDERSPVHLTISDTRAQTIKKTFDLPENLPIIQQRAIGFRPFIQSDARELRFYAIIPEIPVINNIPFIEKPPFLMPAIAKKIREEEVPGHGRLLKIEVVSAWRWPYNSVKSELWYDVATGSLRKFLDTGTFIPRKTGEIVQNNP